MIPVCHFMRDSGGGRTALHKSSRGRVGNSTCVGHCGRIPEGRVGAFQVSLRTGFDEEKELQEWDGGQIVASISSLRLMSPDAIAPDAVLPLD